MSDTITQANKQTASNPQRDLFLTVMVWIYMLLYGIAFLAISTGLSIPAIRKALPPGILVALTNPLSILFLLVVLGLLVASLRGLWSMRRWGAYLFGGYLVSNLVVNIYQGSFKPGNYVLDLLMLVAIGLSFKRMT